MAARLQQDTASEHVVKRHYEYGLLLKAFTLALLSLSNAAVIVLTHYVRTRQGDMFLASSAVVTSEVIKVSTCLLITLVKSPFGSFPTIYSTTLGKPKEWAMTALPACLYAIQNNLVFFALSHLCTVIFQVTYQLKILTTALFSVVMLKKSLKLSQWFSLLLLFIGVVVVQTSKGNHSVSASNADHNKTLALGAVLTASLLSGFAGVYFEKMLKASSQSVWIRNIQLGIPCGIFAFITMLVKDRQEITSRGFFHGYDITVWILVVLQATGGLLVASVVKYTDNIIKTFAMAIAILISLFVSSLLFHTDLDLPIIIGSNVVILAVYLYSLQTQ